MVMNMRAGHFVCLIAALGVFVSLPNEPGRAQVEEDVPPVGIDESPAEAEDTTPAADTEDDFLDDLLRDTFSGEGAQDQDGSIFTPGADTGPSSVETIEAIEAPGSGGDRMQSPEGPVEISDRRATLRALEKVTARIQDLDVGLDETVVFKSLEITMRTCNKRPPEETPETTAFLEIVDNKPDGEPVSVFTGWMFASSPALNALEHPVYDVWVIDCKISDPAAGTGSL